MPVDCPLLELSTMVPQDRKKIDKTVKLLKCDGNIRRGSLIKGCSLWSTRQKCWNRYNED